MFRGVESWGVDVLRADGTVGQGKGIRVPEICGLSKGECKKNSQVGQDFTHLVAQLCINKNGNTMKLLLSIVAIVASIIFASRD